MKKWITHLKIFFFISDIFFCQRWNTGKQYVIIEIVKNYGKLRYILCEEDIMCTGNVIYY